MKGRWVDQTTPIARGFLYHSYARVRELVCRRYVWRGTVFGVVRYGMV